MCSEFIYSFVWSICDCEKNLATYCDKSKQIVIQITRFLLEFIHTCVCRQILEVLKYKILWQFVQFEPSCNGQTVGQTQLTKTIVVLLHLKMRLKADKMNRYAVTSGHNLSAYRSLAHKLLISSCSLGIRIMLKWMQFHAKPFLLYETETRTTSLLTLVAGLA